MEEDLNKVGMQTLLDKIGVLNFKYEKLNDENKFNIFTILRGSHEEVNLHSRFIFELLNPEGTHNERDEFLNSFLETIGIQDFETDGALVRKEHDNIDILITNNQKKAIIIENKIRAGDQEKQLERYYEKMKNRDKVCLVYLTLHGDKPSEDSLGNLSEDVKKKLITISYSEHILTWLEECIEKSSRKPLLREAIIQYENLVKEITGNTMSEEQVKEVYELLKKGDNFSNANTIGANWDGIKWHLEWNFWHDFEDIISKEENVFQKKEATATPKYTISGLQKYSDNQWENKNTGTYGIMFELFSRDKGKDRFCLFIERSDVDLYYGITLVRNEERVGGKEYEELSQFLNWLPANYWLGYKHFDPRINFEALTPKTLNLINKDKREKWLNDAWRQIKESIEKILEVKAEVLDKST